MSLEDKVKDKESKGFMRKAARIGWKLGMAAATTVLSMATVGTLGIWVGAAFAAGSTLANLAKGKSLYETIDKALTTYSAVNAVIYPMVWLGDMTFPLIPNEMLSGKIMRGLYASTLYNAAFVGGFRIAGHLVDNYLNPKGIGNAIKKDFWRDCAVIGALFSPFYYLVANNITQIAFNNFYVPKFTSQGIMPQYVNQLVTPTFSIGAVPTGFIYNKWVNKE